MSSNVLNIVSFLNATDMRVVYLIITLSEKAKEINVLSKM